MKLVIIRNAFIRERRVSSLTDNYRFCKENYGKVIVLAIMAICNHVTRLTAVKSKLRCNGYAYLVIPCKLLFYFSAFYTKSIKFNTLR